MLSSFRPSSDSADTPEVATYKALRSASKSWAEKLSQHPASKSFDLLKAARKLGISVEDRTIIFEAEFEMAVMMDHYLLDYRPDGKSLAESATFAPGELAPLVSTFHEACLASRTSLYLITAVQEKHPQILLRDRLRPDEPELWLTDIALAATVHDIGGQVLIFTRVVSAQGLHFTGGFSFVFDPKNESAILDSYRRAQWAIPAKRHDEHRISFFLGMNRRIGLEQGFADVQPPS